MQNMSNDWLGNVTSLARVMRGKVELYKGSTLSNTFLPTDNLSSIQIERTPAHGNFFGYSICQKATVSLIDRDGVIDISNGDELKVFLGVDGEYASNPTFTVENVTRDEVRKTITVIAYDLLSTATNHKQKELTVTYPITLSGYADLVASFLNTTIKWDSIPYVNIEFDGVTNIPNFSGEETLRDVLNGIAAAAGAVCFINGENKICFKQFKANPTPIGIIDKNLYFNLTIGEPITLTKVTSTTQLGDNISYGTDDGFNQVIRDNPFMSNREDLPTIVTQLAEALTGITFYPYNTKWRGNPAFEIGDCVTIECSGVSVNMFYLGETISYTGGLRATSEWQLKEQGVVHSNSATLGETIKETYAKVDKVNKQIELVISEVNDYEEKISQIQMDIEGIDATVKDVEKQVSATISAEDVAIEVSKQLQGGVNSVTTTTGFTFNEEGLTVSKTGTEMSTTVTEDGMTVNRGAEDLLVANNEGVTAVNLHATTYLIIGENSRFEDYIRDSEPRTGCFWIGGT